MRALTSSFWLTRAGNDATEYEDAFCPRKDGRHSARRLRLAVADGASESILSGRWADVLTQAWCKAQRAKVADVLRAAVDAWDEELAAYLEGRDKADRPVQWFEEPGLARGAFATLLGVQFTTRRSGSGGWTAVSMGDTCLFQVRDGELVTAFPVKSASEFGSTPNLVPSRPEDFDLVLAHIEERDGDWQSGDRFYLGTDAVAAWFLAEVEAGRTPWEELSRFESRRPSEFKHWVGERRATGELRNDDVTLVRVDVL